jgi:plastocyanin
MASLALLLALLAMPVAPAFGAEDEAGATQTSPTLWDYRTVFVVWDDATTDWRADWDDGTSTIGLEAVLDNEGSIGWELDSIAHERYDLIVGAGTTSQEARRLRLIFRRPLVASDAAAAAAVTIQGFAFQPGALEIAAGTTVTWTNADSVQHTATASDGTFDSGALAPGASFDQTFSDVGSFGYACAIHPGMTGTIVVS